MAVLWVDLPHDAGSKLISNVCLYLPEFIVPCSRRQPHLCLILFCDTMKAAVNIYVPVNILSTNRFSITYALTVLQTEMTHVALVTLCKSEFKLK